MTFEALSAVDDAVVVVGISSLDGVPASLAYSTEKGRTAWSLGSRALMARTGIRPRAR